MKSAKEVKTGEEAVARALSRHVKEDLDKHAEQFSTDLWDAGYTLVHPWRKGADGTDELMEFVESAERFEAEEAARVEARKKGKQ